ncbi:MAG: HAMP domain-containing histidine kinase [Candidatus Binatia bacterium]|nr:HAMP domain-containing histidine kinase [Candidatus Binatia bacterium]
MGTSAEGPLEVEARHVDGRPLFLVMFASLLPARPRAILVVACARQLSEKVTLELQKERAAREKAESELRDQSLWSALGTLVGRVAHDIRNPLFGMLATIDALEAKIGAPDVQEYFNVLRSEGHRLNRLLEELLAFGRGGRARRREIVELGGVVGEAMRQCEQLAKERGVTLKIVHRAASARVNADEEHLVQAVQNIVQNAVQHSRPGSEVAAFTSVLKRKGGGMAVCEVWDAGPGFRPEDLPHVFEPFFSRRSGGTGLGLAIAARIVSDHGGTIRVGNRPRGGAWVRIEIPVARERRSSGPSE